MKTRRAATSFAALAAAFVASACATAAARPPDPLRVMRRSDVRALADSLIGDARFRSAQWGVLIVHPERGDTLYSRNAGKLFIPASNMKLVTSAVALARLGSQYRFRTTFATTGTIAHDILIGDLVIIGRGDPTISIRMREDALAPLRVVADSLAARGIRRIAGRIVEAGDAFQGPNASVGWEWDDLDAAYGAGVDQLTLNEGFAEIRIFSAPAVGLPALVVTAPTASYPPVRNETITIEPPALTPADSADSTRRRIRPRVARDTLTGGVVVSGSIVLGDSASATISLRDPAFAYLVAVHEALESRGIAVDSGIGVRIPDSLLVAPPEGAPAIALDTLGVLESPTLDSILPALGKPSQNQIAELLLRTLALEGTGIGRADSGRRVVERQLVEWGIAADGFTIIDGSGLARQNLLTPETIVGVLDVMRRDSLFGAFVNGLPIAGVDGTLERRMRGTLAEGNVRAKTGSMSRVSALSGYVTTRDGEVLLFSVVANNFTTAAAEITRVQDALAAALASLEWRRR